MHRTVYSLALVVLFFTIFTNKAISQGVIHYKPRTIQILDSVNFEPPIYQGKNYPPLVSLSLSAFGDEIQIRLWQNVDLFAANYTRQVRNKKTAPYEDPGNLCQYTGKVIGANGSHVALSLCNGLHGLFYNGEDLFVIDSRDNHLNGGYLIQKKDNHVYDGAKLHKDYGPRYIETVMILDEAMSRKDSTSKVFDTSELTVNIANVVLNFLNIRMVLQETVLDNGKLGLTNRQESVERFRRDRQLSGDTHDFTLMISGFGGDGYLEGQTPLQSMCLTNYSVAMVIHPHSEVQGAQTVARVIGHSIGIGHDDPKKCTCNKRPCIMSITERKMSIHWSECSMKDFQKFFKREQDTCLRNRPETLVPPVIPICGNGKVELGEECDCSNNCENEECCNAETCMYVPGGQCSKGNCCNTQSCRLKMQATLCRASADICDFNEYCDGTSAECPTDTFLQDGSECKNGENYCFGGKCRTLDMQCKQLWGPETEVAEESCFHSNKRGNSLSYCTYDKLSGSYKACQKKDILCGSLFCTNVLNRNLIGSQWSTVTSELGVYRDRRTSICTAASIDLGLGMTDPGMVHDGVKCGSDKMCLSNKCVSVESLNITKNTCSHQGTVNNLGQCHCNVGYGGDDCSVPGPGGSKNSGPASVFIPPTIVTIPKRSTTKIYQTTKRLTKYTPMTTIKQKVVGEDKSDESSKEEEIVEEETRELKEEALTEIDDALDSLFDSLVDLK